MRRRVARPRRWVPWGLVLCGCAGSAAAATPTFGADIAPILAAHCVACHRPGQIAASVELLSYAAARSRAAAIKQQVRDRAMPPWPADSARSLAFRNDPSLEQRDIDTLVAWVDAGAPRGVSRVTPLPPAADGWRHPQGRAPDAVLTLPLVNLPASGQIPYMPLRVKVPLAHDVWIAALEVRPGNAAVVHHMGITEVELASAFRPEQLEAFDQAVRQLGIPEGALETSHPAVTDPVSPQAFDMLGVYTPGTTFERYPRGAGKLLKGGGEHYINFNVHYTANGTAQTDRSQLALWFLDRPPRHQLFRTPAAVASLIANGRQLLTDDAGTKAEGTDVAIPPISQNAENYELVGMTAFTHPVTIYQLQPHAHMRAKDFTYTVVYPDGREQTVLTVPKYDFHWQLAYDLATPLELPAGSKLVVTAHYDNSAENPHLRELGDGDLARNCGPDKAAYFREENQSWDEMFTPLIQYSISRTRRPLKIVQVLGCLVPTGGSTSWALVNAGHATPTATQSTSAAALRSVGSQPLGVDRYRLLGAAVFEPQRRTQQKFAVKGVLIDGVGGSALNVTSMQSVAGACPSVREDVVSAGARDGALTERRFPAP